MSQVEQFSKADFEAALTAMSSKGKVWQEPVVDKGEYVYCIPVAKTCMRLVVRSSIDPLTDQARASGEDSIKVRVQYESNGSWREFGKIAKAHVKRLTGWQERLKSMLRETYMLAAEAHNERLRALQATIAKPVSKPETHTLGKPAVSKPETPSCPKCGASMALRTARKGNNAGGKFWGCSQYHTTGCRGSLEYSETPAPTTTITTTTKREWAPTPQQQAIFDFIINGIGNAVIEAVAGAGKTSTIVKSLELLDHALKVAFVCFNVKIKDELVKRAPAFVHVSTLNSLGNGNVKGALKSARFDQHKLLNIIDSLADNCATEDEYVKVMSLKGTIAQIVDLVKANMLEGVSYVIVEQLADKYGIDIEDDDRDLVTLLAKTALEQSVKDSSSYDYSDQIYWSATGLHGVACKQFDVVFVDEAQDLNKAQIAMVLKSVKTGGRVIAVGDRHQSIYGFRGADTQAIPNLIEALNATTLPLSVTFRCPKSHVAMAQAIVPQIEALSTAAEGVLGYLSLTQSLTMFVPGDLVLSRVNASLVKPAFALIRRGVKAIILGKDIGDGLIALIDKIESKTGEHTLVGLLSELEEYKVKQTIKLNARKKANQAQLLEDKVETIGALAEDCDTIHQLKEKIDAVFSDSEQGVVFSSIHKAKGSEAERVFVLKPELLPHPKATSDWQIEQEYNIKYVALTRSKRELYLVSEPEQRTA